MSELINGWYCAPYPLAYNSLTIEEKKHNANKAMTILRKNGFTIYASAGVVGNMWAASQMNPSTWEVIDNVPAVYRGGYGLVQWTPYTDYSNWAGADWENNGDKEMERLIYERDTNIEFWHNQTTMPGWSWTRFCAIEPSATEPERDAVNLAAEVFVYRYLAPRDPAGSLANRQYLARWVYENAPGMGVPIWLLYKLKEKNRKGGRL